MGDGDAIVALCIAADQQNGCMAYLAGVTDALVATGRICLPERVTIGRIIGLSLSYLRRHREQYAYSSGYLVASALTEAFPCISQK